MTRLSFAAVVGLLCIAAVLSCASNSAADEWTDFHIMVNPSTPTDEQTFDLRAFSWFSDSGYWPLSQSIEVVGDQINVRALVQDQHSRPGMVFATVMTPGGAFFNDYGPLDAGDYQVNAEVWLTFWPATTGGFLYDQGTHQFTVTGLSPNSIDGDFNGDTVVDAADYGVWRNSVGQSGPDLPADGDGDEDVDGDDYMMWKMHYGESLAAGGGSASSSPTPEPSSWLLVLAAAMLVGLRRAGQNCREI